MNKWSIRFCLAALTLTILGTGAMAVTEDKSTKPRIAVIEFKNQADNQPSAGNAEAIQDVFVTELGRTGKFSVLARKQRDAILRRNKLAISGDIDKATAVRIGKLLGVNYILTGLVTEYGVTDPSSSPDRRTSVVALRASLIDTSTGEVVWTSQGRQQGNIGASAGRNNELKQVSVQAVQHLVASLRSADL